jgi:uncharacterized protein YndB with AHSA1/START domain
VEGVLGEYFMGKDGLVSTLCTFAAKLGPAARHCSVRMEHNDASTATATPPNHLAITYAAHFAVNAQCCHAKSIIGTRSSS